MSSTASAERTSRKGFFGHPWGLANLAGVEMWERFSFYGMQGLLAYYIYYATTDGGLGMSEAVATSIVGAYGGLVYLSSVLGGWIADRVLGAEKTVVSAAVIVMIGHLSLSLLPGGLGLGIGLVCIALGSGSLKVSTSTTLGDLYDLKDNRRDAAFSIYYMGVNIGGLIGPLATSALWGWKGFHWGFGLAAVLMAVGLVQYLAMRRHTRTESSSHPTSPLSRAEALKWIVIAVVAIAIVAVAAGLGWLNAGNLANVVVVVTIVAAVVLFCVIAASKKITAIERSRVFGFIPLFIGSAVFWSLFQQQFTVLAIYADQRLDRNLFGIVLPPSIVQSINPFFIIVFAAAFAAMWTKLGDKQPSTPVKFSIGTIVMGIAFFVFIPLAGGGANSVPMLVMVLVYFLFTMAELCLSPVGQSLATKLAPQAFHSQMVALFFLSVALGSAASGSLAGFYSADAEVPYFLVIGGISVIVGILLFIFRRPILKLMQGVR
ncbi:oligopeptide:H+ symporter [Brevibacterium sp. 50QC2O2]|jgi:POT family proton-dependent oligopeptide transporter|uniref:peptide MFS transporter n=1 Tax=Brevibacterium TaxID=1696 RepID=UPI00211C840E|nr:MULTISPECIES: oligopeptide:H+ symporter [unclassified Brevibacterium]MCQ9368379.1 oligopeptide:H+ symporter [Brevibacterium sp. 91QC2O2]MCQ9384707.1 oligopeptide:H+ symporter [Brevibacterium sp. 68QC2CO]MCQ9387470.1 oligopeptide:H+ symporter [Brevibacterium sp. 50QC2O2]